MALDSKTIKEEILDKDIYEANAIRTKGKSMFFVQLCFIEVKKNNNGRNKYPMHVKIFIDNLCTLTNYTLLQL